MKRFSKFAMMALAVLMAACSQNEKFDEENKLIPEDGEKTWVGFSFKFSESMTRAGEGGTEDGVDGELAVNTAAVYIFKDDGSYEATASTVAEYENSPGTSTGEWHSPAAAVKVTSGNKTFVAILNDRITDRATPDNLSSFLAVVEDATISTLYATVTAEGATLSTIQNMLMTGKATADLAADVSEVDAMTEGNPNHVRMNVDRAAAKLDVAISKDLVIGSDPALATLVAPTYDVLNLHKGPYTFLQDAVNGVIPTPKYELTSYLTYKDFYYNQSAVAASPILELKSGNGNVYGKDVAYLPENTNMNPAVGNTSYVFLKTTFVPTDKTFAAYDENTCRITASSALTSTATGCAMYSFDYDFTFQPLALTGTPEAKDVDTDQIKQLISHHLNRVKSLNVLPRDIYAKWDEAVTPVDIPTIEKLSYFYTITKVTPTTAGIRTHYVIKIECYQPSNPVAPSAPTIVGSFSINPLTVGVYGWDEVNSGLICYYRINIFDIAYTPTLAMYYSVIRNNAYHVLINSVNQIGYPEPSDVEVAPDTPLIDYPTYMQVHITINKWTAKNMGVDLGI